MNIKRLIVAILILFVGVFITDFLIHGVWLQPVYKATASLWRTEPEMTARMGWMFLGQFLAAAMFTTIWAAGFADRRHLRCACIYGLFMGLFSQAMTIITYVVQPFPPSLAVKWFAAGVTQGLLLGLLVHLAYKPKPAEGAAKP
jgi:hypothetical protein